MAGECGQPAHCGGALHEGRRGVDVCPGQLGADHGRREQPRGRDAGGRVGDVVAAGRRPRGGDGAGPQRRRAEQAAAVTGVLDGDPPGGRVRPGAVDGDVAAGVDQGVVGAEVVQASDQTGECLLDRPALDQSGRVEPDRALAVREPGGEGAAGALAGELAQRGDMADPRMRVAQRVASVPDPADRTVRPPDAEHRLVRPQLRVRLLDRLGDGFSAGVRATDVDAHRQPHDLGDEGAARESGGGGPVGAPLPLLGRLPRERERVHGAGHRCALSMADCKDWR